MELQQSTPHTQHVVIRTQKSIGVALVLTFFFGPLGMLYSTVTGGIIMMVISGIVAVFTLGFGLLVVWPICMVWAAVAVNNHNKKMLR